MVYLCFATNNLNKIAEIGQILGDEFKIQSLNDIGCFKELPENQDTLEGNSLEKAQYVFDNYQTSCFADDTGLEVKALEGDPGVMSARYAGMQKDSNDNIELLLKNLLNVKNREARFRTVITLITPEGVNQFEGIIEGEILTSRRGDQGFGYDPVFQPSGYSKSFAELSMMEKNMISHRALAFRKLVNYLKTNPIS
jgi:XTP/dITP diphosphohydrolase